MDGRARTRVQTRLIEAVSGLAVVAIAVTGGIATSAGAAPGDGILTVEVNRDFSGDGIYEQLLDPGQAGFEVTVTDGTSTIGPILTDADGQVDVDLSGLAGSRFRVDVTIPATAPDYLEFAPAATTATVNAFRSATSFVDGSTQTIHVGVWNPNTYVPRNPLVAIAQQKSRPASASQRSIMVTEWNNRGPLVPAFTDNTDGISQVASQAETGAVFGLAWEYRSSSLFSAAYAKAYTNYGPGGSGAIYRTDTSAGGASGNTALWATIPNAGTSTHQTIVGRDDAFFLAAGSEGLGGLALSEDGSTLYAMNLNDKTLYSLATADAAPAAPAVVAPVADPGCVGGAWRPFAVAQRDGEVYVGGICDASVSLARADLSVHVLRLDGAAFTEIYAHGLDFIRGNESFQDPTPNLTDPEVALHWNPWRATWDADLIDYNSAVAPERRQYPMPLLTTLAFENDGSLVLSFRDRKTDAIVSNGFGPDGTTRTPSHQSAGDINKVCLAYGVYEWEGTGACPNNATPANSGQPADRVEYFPGDSMYLKIHTETSLGAVLLSPREADLINTSMNPTNSVATGGLGFYDRLTGTGPGNDWERNGLLIAGNNSTNFGKGSGLGAISLLAAPAPIQIGNYVWFDGDRDGEQDADEIAVPGATVRLLAADGTVLATTTTDANGEYYFGGEGGYALTPGAEYIVEFDMTTVDPTPLPGAPSLDELSFTRVQEPGVGEIHDSNPTPTPQNPLIGRAPVTAPDHPGGVNHTIDAGIILDRPGIDIVKFDGREDPLDDPVDGPDAVDDTYGGPTPGDWEVGVDADTQANAVEYEVTDDTTGPQTVTMIITNTGTSALADVVVSDSTIEGADLEDLTCDFSLLNGPSSGTTWAGPFQPEDSFECSGTLTMGYDEIHHNIASVSGQPVDEDDEPFGDRIGDEDPYWATTPAAPLIPGIDIVKFDGRMTAPIDPVDGPDAVDGVYGDPTLGDWTTEVDADTEDDAVEYPLTDGTTGAQPVTMIITNTGEAPLTDVSVADLTVEGSALAGVTCDFSLLGGPETGTTWAGPFGPDDSFICEGTLTMGPSETHADIASVTGQPLDAEGAPAGERIGDEDPYWAITPALPAAPGLAITKRQAGTGVEADTAETILIAKAGEKVAVEIPVRNTGNTALLEVVVSDHTDEGPAMTDFACTFPDGIRVAAVAGSVRWVASFGDPATAQWEPGATFICTGVVTLAAGQRHADTVTVEAVAPDGPELSASNAFHVRTLAVPALAGTGEPVNAVLIGWAFSLMGGGLLMLFLMRRSRVRPGRSSR